MVSCPVCKSTTQIVVEECENDAGDYTAHACLACEWRSDRPAPQAAHDDSTGYCEACSLPIRNGEIYMLWGDDVVTHCDCPKVAQA